MGKLRFAVIGAGGMGRTHISALSHLPDQFEVAAIGDVSLTAATQASVEYAPQALVFVDYKAMLLETADLDGVIIALPHDQLAEATIFALEHGMNTLCEKPGCLTVGEFHHIEDAALRSSAVYALGFIKRYHRMFEAAEARIQAGDVGEILHVVFNDEWRHRGLHDLFEESWEADMPNWRSVRQHMGRDGIGNDTTAHALSALLALTNHLPNEVLMVDSRDSQAQYLRMEGPDSYDIRLRIGERGRAVANTSWAHNDAGEPMFRVYGTSGQLDGRLVKDEQSDPIAEMLTYTKFRTEGEDETDVQVWAKESEARRQLTDFGHCIRNSEVPRNGLPHIQAFIELRERIFNFNEQQTQAKAEMGLAELAVSTQ